MAVVQQYWAQISHTQCEKHVRRPDRRKIASFHEWRIPGYSIIKFRAYNGRQPCLIGHKFHFAGTILSL